MYGVSNRAITIRITFLYIHLSLLAKHFHIYYLIFDMCENKTLDSKWLFKRATRQGVIQDKEAICIF